MQLAHFGPDPTACPCKLSIRAPGIAIGLIKEPAHPLGHPSTQPEHPAAAMAATEAKNAKTDKDQAKQV